MTIGGEFNCDPEGLFNVLFECEGTTGAGLLLFSDGAKGETMMIGAVVADGGSGVEVVELMGFSGAGVEEGGSNDELDMEVMLLKEVFFSSQSKPGKEMFWGIATTEEFVTCDAGIVLFEDFILVAFAGAETSGAVVLSRDVAFIFREDELFTAEAFFAARVELLREVEFSAWVVSDEKGCDGEGRNRTVSFSGGVAMMYDAFSYSEFSAGNDGGEGLATEFP